MHFITLFLIKNMTKSGDKGLLALDKQLES